MTYASPTVNLEDVFSHENMKKSGFQSWQRRIKYDKLYLQLEFLLTVLIFREGEHEL